MRFMVKVLAALAEALGWEFERKCLEERFLHWRFWPKPDFLLLVDWSV